MMDADWDMDLPHSNDYSLIAGPHAIDTSQPKSGTPFLLTQI